MRDRLRAGPLLLALLLACLPVCLPACLVYAPLGGAPPATGPTRVLLREADSWFTDEQVVVIPVEGVLDATPGGLLGAATTTVADFVQQLDAARADPDVRAVVLRIDSPGGTVTASDQMYRELMAFRRDTGLPVVACLLDVAASGAYYLAMACDELVAHPTTITGSIGVITELTHVDGLFELVGLGRTAITSGRYKDIGSPYRAPRDDELRLLQGLVDAHHARFVDVVARGRPGLPREQVEALADGRVFVAEQALEAGLVDRIGYMDDAMHLAREKAGITDASAISYRPGSAPPQNLYARGSGAGSAWLQLLLGRPRMLYLWTGR